jgi:hypothetical protein
MVNTVNCHCVLLFFVGKETIHYTFTTDGRSRDHFQGFETIPDSGHDTKSCAAQAAQIHAVTSSCKLAVAGNWCRSYCSCGNGPYSRQANTKWKENYILSKTRASEAYEAWLVRECANGLVWPPRGDFTDQHIGEGLPSGRWVALDGLQMDMIGMLKSSILFFPKVDWTWCHSMFRLVHTCIHNDAFIHVWMCTYS